MSDENNNNNETSKSKINLPPNEQDNITTNTNIDNKNSSNLESPKRTTNRDLVISLVSLDRKSSKTLIDEGKIFSNLLDNETVKSDSTNKDILIKRTGVRKKSIRKKRKKGKKGKKSEPPELESILLTEVKQIPKKKEESENQKYLRKKLDNFNFSKNLLIGIGCGFIKANDEIKSDLVDNYNINENKKKVIEEIVSKPKTNLKLNLNLNKKGIKYNIDKQSIIRLLNLKKDEKIIKSKLKKIEENQKFLDLELPIKNDIITLNNRKNNLRKISSMKNDLLSKLSYNSSKISELIDSNRTINRNALIKNFMSPEIHKNSRNNELFQLNTLNKQFCLSEEQEKFNKHLLQIQKEEKFHREKLQKDLKISSEKKIKEIELSENKKFERQKNYLEELKKKEKDFFNKMKEKNNLILEKSIKYIDEKNHKKKKDYLFFQIKQKFENNEKKLIDKVNMMKKDSLVTKKEIEELAQKREEQKRILEEGLNERKIKLIKMWKERSQTLPVYKHPIVDKLEDEEFDLLDEEEDKKEQKEKNEKEKRNYQPPKVKIDKKLKLIRENRNIKTNKESVSRTEINNKNRLLNNLNFMANIIEAAKEENLEKKMRKKMNSDREEKRANLIMNKYKVSKSIDIKENKIRHNYKLHPKPEKPIDYLRELIKKKKTKEKVNKIDVGVGDIFCEIKDKKDTNHIMEALDMVKSKTNAIDRKVFEKKEFLKAKGGYINNTKLGDEVGNLLIESIKNKLSLLNKLNGK